MFLYQFTNKEKICFVTHNLTEKKEDYLKASLPTVYQHIFTIRISYSNSRNFQHKLIMNRLFGKGKGKEPPPNLTDCIANVSVTQKNIIF